MIRIAHSIIFTLIVFISGCIIIPVSPHSQQQITKVPEPPKLVITAANVFVNGKSVFSGDSLLLMTGQQIVVHDGQVSLPFTDKPTMSGAETAKMLGCLALLPLCALARQEIFPKSDVRYKQSQCTGRSDFDAKPDQDYSVEVIVSVDSMPIIKVSNVTHLPYVVSEAVMTCKT